MMAFDPISAIFNVGGKLIDKLIPDPTAKAAAKLELATLAQSGELKEMEVAMSAILVEAQSSDPWTSRARPSFMYVMYVMILAALPMGVLTVFSPDSAAAISLGMKEWLAAIPESLWALFGVGYTGYAVSRTYDKHSRNKHNAQ